MRLLLQHDAREDAARVDAQPAGREIVGVLLIGTDVKCVDLLVQKPRFLQLQAIAQGQVDVPFLPTFNALAGRHQAGNTLHDEPFGHESIVNLLSNLKTLQADARPYLCR